MIRRSSYLWIVASLVVFEANSAFADDDTLKPLTFASFQTDVGKALSKSPIKDRLTLQHCLDGAGEKRTVCTYKLGSYMVVYATSPPKEKDLIGITAICATQDGLDAAKCLVASGVFMTIAGGDADQQTKGKILTSLLRALDLGIEISITTEDRKYTAQKSIGLWLHIFASGAKQ